PTTNSPHSAPSTPTVANVACPTFFRKFVSSLIFLCRFVTCNAIRPPSTGRLLKGKSQILLETPKREADQEVDPEERKDPRLECRGRRYEKNDRENSQDGEDVDRAWMVLKAPSGPTEPGGHRTRSDG
ncbi:MAG TPA: hypothetical protein VN444_02370, partial [Verrucomicrobiae bacterium]|nr:hypothetical protein [Verrucomicrobiae bacterium]